MLAAVWKGVPPRSEIARATAASKPAGGEVIRLACEQDYESFYEREIRLRKLLAFPPFCDIVLLTMVSGAESELLRAGQYLSTAIKHLSQTKYNDVALQTFGPFEAPVYRVDNKYRMRMVAKCKLGRRSLAMFAELLCEFSLKAGNRVTLAIDFNPSNL